MAAIELIGVEKRFGAVTALRDLDLVVDEGEVFGFLGPNGAGKSTTINVLLDFVRPTAGTARVLGYDAQDDSETIRRRVGVLPEGFGFYERLSGREHVKFAMQTKRVDGDPETYLRRVGLGDDADRAAGEYSKGMRQRLALGIALVGEPDLLILDEPSTGLDPTGIGEMQDIVRAEAERGTTVFFSSHILPQVEAVCDRIGVMHDGELVSVGTLEELRETIGADAVLELTLDDVGPDLLDALSTVDGVTAVERDGTELTIGCAEPVAKGRAIRRVHDAGATVLDVRTEEQSLGEVFARLTDGGTSEREAPPEEVVA